MEAENTLAYYDMPKINTAKRFIAKAKLFTFIIYEFSKYSEVFDRGRLFS